MIFTISKNMECFYENRLILTEMVKLINQVIIIIV